MESLKSNPKLYDPVRSSWVKKTPEEEVRIALLQKMIEDLGFPLSFLAVEKELASLPHLLLTPKKKIPPRRADIICFAKGIHADFALYPLLMVECKVSSITPPFLRQVVGYNESVGAPFLAVASKYEIVTGSYNVELGMYDFKPGLPSYRQLLHSLPSHSQSEVIGKA